MNNQNHIEERIHDYLAGTLTGDALQAFETELQNNPELRKDVDEQMTMHADLQSLAGTAMPAALQDRILQNHAQPASTRLFPRWGLSIAAVVVVAIGLLALRQSGRATLENASMKNHSGNAAMSSGRERPQEIPLPSTDGGYSFGDGDYPMAATDDPTALDQTVIITTSGGLNQAVIATNSLDTTLDLSGETPMSADDPQWDDILPEDSTDPSREEYLNTPYENSYMLPRTDPLSTFSIDVDTASYSMVRNALRSGYLPNANAVRLEELINYFSYNYPEPDEDQPFSVITEVAQCPWNPDHKLMQIGLQGRRMIPENMPPMNLVFLIDVSGSMSSSNKLPLLKQAMSQMVDRLSRRDTVSIVVYAGNSGLALPPTRGNEHAAIKAALNSLQSGGSTAGGAGINLAYSVAQEQFIDNGVNRVILCTDGDFNVGVSHTAGLQGLIEEKRETGVFFTGLGFGMGNYQDDTLKTLSKYGNGNYYYIDSITEAKKALGRDLSATLVTIAKDVKIQVEFNPAVVAAYRLVGYENRILAAQDFNDDKKDAGEIGAGHNVTALYEIIPVGAKVKIPGIDPLKYQAPADLTAAAQSDDMATVKLRYKFPNETESRLLEYSALDADRSAVDASENLQWAAAVASFGLSLRESQYKGDSSFALSHELAQGSIGDDPHGIRAEFMELLKLAVNMKR